jgi:hypothetical protein
MPVHLREQFEPRVTSVVRASALPDVLLALQITRWEFGCSVPETVQAVAMTDGPLSREFGRWAA